MHIASLEQLSTLVLEIPPLAQKLMAKYWPGPLTLVFKAKPNILSDLVTAGGSTVAIRWPDCELEIDLLKNTGPLVAPSANMSGDNPALSIEMAQQYFKDTVDIYLDGGDSRESIASTILDISENTPKLLRLGGIALLDEDYMLEF